MCNQTLCLKLHFNAKNNTALVITKDYIYSMLFYGNIISSKVNVS